MDNGKHSILSVFVVSEFYLYRFFGPSNERANKPGFLLFLNNEASRLHHRCLKQRIQVAMYGMRRSLCPAFWHNRFERRRCR